jgi:hypothetical protein
MNNTKRRDPVPDDFGSYEAAAEFWDTHDTTDYPELFETVNVHAELRRRRYEVEIAEDVMLALRTLTERRGMSVSNLASDMLRQQIRLSNPVGSVV